MKDQEAAAARWAVEGLPGATLSGDLVMADGAYLRPDRLGSGTLLPQTPPVPRGGVIKVFLDHGASSWHQEVFYAVAKKLEREFRASHNSALEFLVEEQNFRDTAALWTKHAKDIKWSTLRKCFG